VVLSDRAEAMFRVNFVDESKPAMDILMADFIDEKSAKAKGKRVTTLEVASIEDITPEPEPESESEEDGLTEDEAVSPDNNSSIEVEGVTMTFEKPKDSQLDLF